MTMVSGLFIGIVFYIAFGSIDQFCIIQVAHYIMFGFPVVRKILGKKVLIMAMIFTGVVTTMTLI